MHDHKVAGVRLNHVIVTQELLASSLHTVICSITMQYNLIPANNSAKKINMSLLSH